MGRRDLESEMEEGEIIDELDDLSDISSSEEFSFLRERASILESYNNVLERKEAKLSQSTGTKLVQLNNVWQEVPIFDVKINRPRKLSHRKTEHKKRRKSSHSECDKSSHTHHDKRPDINIHSKDKHKKKPKSNKKGPQTCVISDTSEASGEEDFHKRIDLANAVKIQTKKIDKTSLKERLMKMTLNSNKKRKQNDIVKPGKKIKLNEDYEHISNLLKANNQKTQVKPKEQKMQDEPIVKNDNDLKTSNEKKTPNGYKILIGEERMPNESKASNELNKVQTTYEIKSLKDHLDTSIIRGDPELSDQRLKIKNNISKMTSKITEKKIVCHENNEEVQYDLIIKGCEPNDAPTFDKESEEDEDSDTQELRLICLKSAALKSAIEMKQKEKLEKRLKNSSQQEDDLLMDIENTCEKTSNGNTDIESVDMDTEMSDNDVFDDKYIKKSSDLMLTVNENLIRRKSGDELDCDVLRSKLLMDVKKKNKEKAACDSSKVVSSDSDSVKKNTLENKNHILCTLEKNDLDRGRKEKENKKIQLLDENERSYTPELPKTFDKKIMYDHCDKAKTTRSDNVSEKNIVNDVNTEKEKDIKSDLIIITNDSSDSETEATKNLTKMHNKLAPIDFQKRLDDLLRETRQVVENEKPSVEKKKIVQKPRKPEKFIPKAVDHLPLSAQKEYNDLVKRITELERKKNAKDCEKTLTTKVSRNVPLTLEEQISVSRKNIAEESAQLLTLKKDGKKLVQRHKMLSIELMNLATAIANNKKKTRLAHTKLSNYQTYHQLLLKKIKHPGNTVNNPYKKQNKLDNTRKVERVERVKKVMKVNIDSTTKEKNQNKKHKEDCQVKMNLERSSDDHTELYNRLREPRKKDLETEKNKVFASKDESNDDYKSPLEAISKATWNGDPHGVLCPFEVSGVCKDSTCKFLHSSPHLFIHPSP